MFAIIFDDFCIISFFSCSLSVVPPQWTVEPKNTSVVLGHRVWIDCAAVGFPTPSILWKKLIHSGKDITLKCEMCIRITYSFDFLNLHYIKNNPLNS